LGPVAIAHTAAASQSPVDEHPTGQASVSLRGRANARDVNIHNHRRHVPNATGSELGLFLDCVVANAARELHDPVMYFNTNCALNNIVFSIKLSEHFLLNLHIVFHQAIPSQLIVH
jgi:hypothetical protein